jgi:nicotinate-nucleotide adenylyltransferase
VIDISSTEVRERLKTDGGAAFLAPAVYGYILREGLYGAKTDLHNLPLDQLRPIALSYLKNKRIPHVLGTEQEAIRLAERYGADVEKARRAALLHDCTKKLSMDEQLELCKKYGIELDELEKKALKLLHSKTGAAIARDLFGVDDEIYSAIWYHTTGHANMTKLEKIIYLADYIEPTRDFPGVEDLRRACYEDLDRGLLLGLEMTITEMTNMGNPVHHATLEARNALKG